ncbi:hypothetical protein ACDQ55_01195 [Chitinophaga sp. 30R24]|uniref:hypothetical protein n=1 Tax=Chitinophaga sp. 30R24 TaxID=3248838 RepID=UPI003B91E468
MKKLLITKYSCLVAMAAIAIGFASCKKSYSSGDDYNFSNTVSSYVELSSKKDVNVKQGASFSVGVQVRTAKQQDITITYELGGGLSNTGSIVLPRNLLTTTTTVSIPANSVPAGVDTLKATLKLSSVGPNKYNLVIGQISPASEVIKVNILR